MSTQFVYHPNIAHNSSTMDHVTHNALSQHISYPTQHNVKIVLLAVYNVIAQTCAHHV